MRVIDLIAALGRFVYRFIVGDDLIVALVMVLALATTAALVLAGINAWWLVPPLAVGMTYVHLAARRSRKA